MGVKPGLRLAAKSGLKAPCGLAEVSDKTGVDTVKGVAGGALGTVADGTGRPCGTAPSARKEEGIGSVPPSTVPKCLAISAAAALRNRGKSPPGPPLIPYPFMMQSERQQVAALHRLAAFSDHHQAKR